jgi:hypothetical protein
MMRLGFLNTSDTSYVSRWKEVGFWSSLLAEVVVGRGELVTYGGWPADANLVSLPLRQVAEDEP